MRKLNIKFDNINYDINIGYNIIEESIIEFSNKISKKNIKYIVIINELVNSLYNKIIKNIFNNNNIYIDFIIIENGEGNKTITTVNNIITYLLHKEYDREVILISFGGGVIGDITGFTASIYLRGVKYIHIPTTLLSQVDSSIGGKTGVNHPLGKNMIGSFYQPSLVIIDIIFLKTLKNKDFISGFSEIIKYGIIISNTFFYWLEENFNKLLILDYDCIEECIYKCCCLKYSIISLDEKETKGIRQLLNLGHTYGHAIESFLGYGNWLHGDAISVGIIMASNLSYITKNIDIKILDRIKNIIYNFNLKMHGPNNMIFEDYLFYMKKDKKNINDNINIVIPYNDIGKSKILYNVSEKLIKLSILYK